MINQSQAGSRRGIVIVKALERLTTTAVEVRHHAHTTNRTSTHSYRRQLLVMLERKAHDLVY
mgnify:CR=1 FL=1